LNLNHVTRKTTPAICSILILYVLSLFAPALTVAQDSTETRTALFDVLYTNDVRGSYEPCG
jgi:hypothetical protein